MFGDECPQSDGNVCEVYLLYFPSETRQVDAKERSSQSRETVAVATCIVADRQGPMLLDLWREPASTMLRQFEAWAQASATAPLVQVKHFFIRTEGRKALTPMRKMVNSKRTDISLLTVGTRPSVLDMHLLFLAEPLFTRDLGRLQQEPPFVVSLAGIVSSVQDEETSQSGRPMRSFRVQDASGRYVQCKTLGRHVDNVNIGNGNEIVLYFAHATTSTSPNLPGQLWVYNESHIILLASGRDCPPARTPIQLRML
jgi:hypothetical protein